MGPRVRGDDENSIQLGADFVDALGQRDRRRPIPSPTATGWSTPRSPRHSPAAARTSASACASASAILLSAVLVRRATKSSILALASEAMRSASALALVMMSWASRSAGGVAGLVFRQQLGGLALEAAGVVEFGLDALAAMIERFQHGAVNAKIGKHAHQDDESDGDPEFRLGEHPTSIPSRIRQRRC